MGTTPLRRRQSAFAAGLATLVMALGFTAAPADAAPAAKIDYVALGDSYTAGTGAGAAERPQGVDCWQSSGGYVDLVAKTGRIDLVANGACHGAVLLGLPAPSPFYDFNLYTPSVDEKIKWLVNTGALSTDTGLVSITAGANDLGFAYVLGQCAFYGEDACRTAVAAVTSEGAFNLLTGNLIKTYTAIRQAAPNATIVVLGYPLLFDTTDPNTTLPISITSQELINRATLAVNAAIEAAALAAGVHYVDVIDEFAGHEVYSADPWLQLAPNDFTADYNFHPNDDGHRAYASALLAAVKPGQLVRR